MGGARCTGGTVSGRTPLMVLLGLVAANYLYQAMTAQDWNTATERSFFQAMAVLFVWAAS